MKLVTGLYIWLSFLLVFVLGSGCQPPALRPLEVLALLDLPEPRTQGEMPLEQTLAGRRSVRNFTAEPLTLAQIGQLFWAAQGVTDPRGFRTAPSAGGLYPLELYVFLPDGFYHYQPGGHRLAKLSDRDLRGIAWESGLRQEPLRAAPAVFLFAAVQARTAARYGDRAARYVDMEVGHAAQNLALQAVALGLGSVPIGAMEAGRLKAALRLPADQELLYLIPVGHPVP